MHPRSRGATYRRWLVALLFVSASLHWRAGDAHAGPGGKADQVITFTDFPTAKTVGDPSFTIAAVASSGLPVSFKSLTAGVCAVHGHTVTLVAQATGTCSVRAHVRGTSRYHPASATRSFTVGAVTPSGGAGDGGGNTQGTGDAIATPELPSGVLLGLVGPPLLLVLAWRRRRR